MQEKVVKLEQFEGPLSLLLKLIEEQQLDITEVALAQVTDQYISILEAQEDLHPEEIADFLVVASKLMLIKSRVLLPDYFSEQIDEEASDLENQLKLYREFIALGKYINKFWRSKREVFSRVRPFKITPPKFLPPKGLVLSDMVDYMDRLLADLEPIVKVETRPLDNKVSIKDKIKTIAQLIASEIDCDFSKIIKDAQTKTDKIVSFLAVLEMVKQREVITVQKSIFADFIVKKNT